jgi:hypothetical protein
MKPDTKDLRDKQDRLVVTAQWARIYAGSMEHYTEPYQSEMLFIEGGKRYWLAVPKTPRWLNANSHRVKH